MEDPGLGPQAQQSVETENTGVGGAPYSADFYMYSFKVLPCTASYAHNWSICLFVHPNEKARRRDPRIYSYEPLPCPFDKKGANCPHGEACPYTHNVYEYHLHPKRFRTQMCQQGASCKRPLCFFAHNLQQLRAGEGQLPRGALPPPLDPSAAQAAAAAAGVMSPSITQQQQQAVAAAAAAAASPGAAGMGQYVPYVMMQTAPGAGNPPVMQARLQQQQGGRGLAHGRASAFLNAQQQQQQPGWVPGYFMPMGPGNAGMMPYRPVIDLNAGGVGGPQQQQYLPTVPFGWQPAEMPGAAGAGLPIGSPGLGAGVAGRAPLVGNAGGFAGASVDTSLMSPQYQLVPDDQVLLRSAGGFAGINSSPQNLLAAQQQAQQDAAIAGSQYSWSLGNAAGPSTASASASMSLLSLPSLPTAGFSSTAAGFSSTASAPCSSSNSLAPLRPGQGGTVKLGVLQAHMQQMSLQDSHVYDL